MTDRLGYDVSVTHDLALVPTTATLFSATNPLMTVAKRLQVTGALSTGATLTLADGATTLVVPANGVPVGSYIDVRCTKVSFGGTGAFIAYA